MKKPYVMISSFPPRKCGIGTFAEEAVRHGVMPYLDGREVHIICHKGGISQKGINVHPVLDPSQDNYYESIADLIKELNPYAIHAQHEFGLYYDRLPRLNRGFLNLLVLLRDYPTVVEPHTIHTNPDPDKKDFLVELTRYAKIVIVKEPLLRLRLEDWVLAEERKGYVPPRNIGVIRHGAMVGLADKYRKEDVLSELKLDYLKDKNIVLLIGWIQKNKRWDYVLKKWEYILDEINESGGNRKDWHLLAAGKLRDPKTNKKAHDGYMELLEPLKQKGLATFFEFTPRNEEYYKVMSLADIVALPSIDETQSGTQARIIAMNKPYVAIPIEGIGLQIDESHGGIPAIDEVETLPDRIVDLAIEPKRRLSLSQNSANYLKTRVGWDIVGRLYMAAYEVANAAIKQGGRVSIKEGSPLFNGHF